RHQLLTDLAVDRMLTVRQGEARKKGATSPTSTNLHNLPNLLQTFQPVDPRRALKYKHQTRTSSDYNVQPLLPYEVSMQGPPVAAADVNGDGLDDVFIGGAAGVPGKLFIQQKDGSFVESTQGQPWVTDKKYEDWGALFFDANGDGRPDLYVASCGYALAPTSELLQDRIYINQGGGRFAKDPRALPEMHTCTAAVAAGDFNGDGKVDLFVGGRLSPRHYPNPTRSYLLRNDGGHFTDVTEAMAPELVHPGGMITAAVWMDFDGMEYPVCGLAQLGQAIYPLSIKCPSYAAFSEASIPQMFGASQLQQAVHYQTDTLASVYLQNRGDGTFTLSSLPNLAQISPIKGIAVDDVDGDGNLDLIVAGNLYEAEPNTPRADAGNGLWLRGDGQGHFTPVPAVESGFLAPLDVTGLALVKTPTGTAVLVANHGDSLQAFAIRRR